MGDARVEGARGRVALAALDAEDVFSQYLSEPHQQDAPVIAWSAMVASAHQLWFGTDVVALVPVAAGGARTAPGPARQVADSATRVADTYRSVAGALVGEARLLVDRPRPMTGEIGNADPVDAFRFFELEAWLEGLVDGAAGLEPSLDRLTGQGRAPAEPVASAVGEA